MLSRNNILEADPTHPIAPKDSNSTQLVETKGPTAQETNGTWVPDNNVAATDSLAQVRLHYQQVRQFTLQLQAPLSPEDCVVQSMPDVSPTKWHLAHTTWFFEQFLLADFLPGYRVFHPRFQYLFNSYYNAVGARHPRPQRGLITRPHLAEVLQYRQYVDEYMLQLFANLPASRWPELQFLLAVGLHHEQQHQELLLTDIKHVLSCNPTYPAYLPTPPATNQTEHNEQTVPELHWLAVPEGIYWLGFENPETEFAYDNETPAHRVFLESFELADRPISNGEYLAFIQTGGYQNPAYWLSDGWAGLQAAGWTAPLYWIADGDQWLQFTMAGLQPLVLSEPVVHLSFYEAEAYARWRQLRLPTEAEWETAARLYRPQHAADSSAYWGTFADTGRFHPETMAQNHSTSHSVTKATTSPTLQRCIGDVWEWTQSPYRPYPGYQPFAGALAEYNGKFMCNQMVLRGGSCATPKSHIRLTYRNFFPPEARWQFTGLRLAR